MRLISMDIVLRGLAFLLVVGLTAYGGRLALGGNNEADSSATSAPSRTVIDEDGAEIYMTRCMACHQMNGRGVPGVFPPVDGTEWVTGDKGRLIRIVLNGITGEIQVGNETYSGAMPPWNSFLDDEEVASLLTYLRTSWSNEASEVTPEEVASVRAATEDRRDPWTEDELNDEANQGIPGAEGEAADPSSESTDAADSAEADTLEGKHADDSEDQ